MSHRGKSAIVCAAAGLLVLASVLEAQLAPLPFDQGAAGLGLALRRLGVTGRVLYVTAHPDDENNAVLVRLSRVQGLRAGVLTLTRGEGGQNELGPELFEALGVLRTEELMASTATTRSSSASAAPTSSGTRSASRRRSRSGGARRRSGTWSRWSARSAPT